MKCRRCGSRLWPRYDPDAGHATHAKCERCGHEERLLDIRPGLREAGARELPGFGEGEG
jgi:RNase P subunit RPR2